jgi:hypothetical protein
MLGFLFGKIFDKIEFKLNEYKIKYSLYANRKVFGAEQGNNIIKENILTKKNFMVSRFGSTELNCAYNIVKGNKVKYKDKIQLKTNAGFFPLEDKHLYDFSKLYLNSASYADAMLTWGFIKDEENALSEYCNNAILLSHRSIEPYYHKDPWTEALKDKRILIIHPFSKSIQKQYLKRKLLFKNKNVLPNFDLITIKAVQSIANNNCGFESWFEALSSMYKKIDNIDFDIAIIGAGAYGLPLSAYIKRKGKISIHMGGATQILFGIKGNRWDKNPYISNLYNKHWVRPMKSEIPSKSKKVENGCYW